MPGLLKNAPVSDAQRRANDTHRPSVVLAVLAVLAAYLYLFTLAADPLGMPLPEDLAERAGVEGMGRVFDSDRNVESAMGIRLTDRFESSDDERMVFLLVLAAAFLCAYFLPVRHKQPALVGWAAVAILLLYGPAATAGLLAAHLGVHAVLHPDRARGPTLAGLAALLAWGAFLLDPEDPERLWLAAALPLGAAAGYRFGLLPLLARPRIAPLLRTLVVQSAIVTVGVSALVEGAGGGEWRLPLGLLLFFWQWERLMMYHVDYKDGLVPRDLGLAPYLAVFWNPGVIPNWNWGVTIGQGYAYCQSGFLAEDKNKLVLGGVKLLLIAMLYLAFWQWARHLLVELFSGLGVDVHRAYTKDLVRHFTRGGEVTTLSVLCTTFLDLVRWTMLWAGIVHFKVGVWRICGYRMDPYIHRPWASTNLTTLWSRFTYHYREFLVRCFYYPVFLRFFKKNRYLRVFVATLAAAGFGNLVWGHVTERLFYRGMEWEHVLWVMATWPYFVLLGVGIGLSHVYLLWRKRRRRPWTWDRWIWTDVLAAYATLQFYALIHIFARPHRDSTTGDLFRLFLKGFGIDVSG